MNPAQDGWLGLPETLGDFFCGQFAVPNGNDRAGEFLLRQRPTADLGGCLLDAQRECAAERLLDKRNGLGRQGFHVVQRPGQPTQGGQVAGQLG